MLKKLMRTSDDAGALLARVFLGAVFFAHGAQLTLGWFGGQPLWTTVETFARMGMPKPVAALVCLAQFLGALGLIVGLLGRVAAFGIAAVMVGAIAMVHWPFGFFMNWLGQMKGEGYEYHLLAIALALIVMVKGSGRWSLDRAIAGD